MKPNKDQAIEALKKILLEEDWIKLKSLEDELLKLKGQIEDKESLIASLDPVIADLLERKIFDSKEEMAEALAPIMGDALKQQISDTKQDIVDALYPIIGQTIRKSVAEAMKKLVDTVNQKIDMALRRRSFKKQVQTKITGVSKGELALKDAMPFQIKEIFLIHKSSGLLISHVTSKKAGVTVDQELISGMLTAIKNFVSEAFKTDEDQELDEIQYGDLKILLEMGRYSYLAIVISGVESIHFRDDLQKLGRRIHNRFHKLLRQFDGDMTPFGEITKPLKHFLNKYIIAEETKVPQKSKPYFLYLLIMLILVGMIVVAVLKIPPFISNWKTQHSIKAKIHAMTDYTDQNIRYRLSNDWLIVSGNVHSFEQKAKIDSAIRSIDGIKGIHNRLVVKDSDAFYKEIVPQIKQRMSQSDLLRDLNPNFILEGDQVIIEGKVPDLKIKREMGYLVSDVAGVNIVINNLEILGKAKISIEDARKFLISNTIYFPLNDTTIAEDEYEKLDAILNYAKRLGNFNLVIKGYSDNLADENYNLTLSEQRARVVAKYLITKNFPQDDIIFEFYGEENPIASNETEQGRAKNRRVEFDIIEKR